MKPRRAGSSPAVFIVGGGGAGGWRLTHRGRGLVAGAGLLACPCDLDGDELAPGVRRIHGEPAAMATALCEAAAAGETAVYLSAGDGVGGDARELATQILSAGGAPVAVPGLSHTSALLAAAGVGLEPTATALLVHRGGLGTEGLGGLAAMLDAGDADLVLLDPPAPVEDARRLGLAGVSSTLPVTLVEATGTARQRSWEGSLGGYLDCQMALPGRPLLLLAGHGVCGPARCPSAENRPLHGRVILVTRAREQAGELEEELHRQGAEVMLCPTIAIETLPLTAAMKARLLSLSGYRWVLFTSANGVHVFFAHLRALGRDARVLGGVRVAAIGPATAAALAANGVSADLVPQEYVAESLVESLAREDIGGARVLLARAQEARDLLPRALRARGATVDVASLYRTVCPAADPSLGEVMARGEVDAVTFTSSSTVRNFVGLFAAGEAARRLADGQVQVACIGPITAATARQAGLQVAVQAPVFTTVAMARALACHLGPRWPDRHSVGS